ncbi:MAG TPA: extracellular solute-binding protein [Candidatus Onthosoma merdavium]|uniref:extracellular solute-binding protein n=1 Tax=Massilicoli timonensis TaxID=2015901 RepID=UPI001FA491EE|nr:extracellular solute-binding protein [Candidatus Onthosoma merdavium]
MKKLWVALLGVAIVLCVYSVKAQGGTIIVYSCMEQFRNDRMQAELEKQFPDKEVIVMYVPTAKAAAKISVEKEQTDADIIIDIETAYMEKIKEQLAPSAQYSKLDYVDDAKTKDDRYVIWNRQAGSIIVNHSVLDKHDLPTPHTYEDLLDPSYQGLIAMPDPKSSGTGYFFLKNLVNVLGEEEAFAYIDRLADNIKQFSESGSGPVKLLVQGEIAIGLGLTFQGVSEYNEGNDLEMLTPEYGSPYSMTGAALIKGNENDEEVLEVYQYLINEYLVIDKEYDSPEQILKKQNNYIENYPKNIRYADMQGIEDLQEKERLLAKWKY